MSQTMPAKTLTLTLEVPAGEVYRYASDPRNLPAWAPGFAKSVAQTHGRWFVQTADARMEFSFVPENPYGVLDHTVTLPDGQTFTSAMRVIPNGAGAELIFTLLQQPGQDRAQFEEDEKVVTADLERLKAVLEGRGR